MYRNKDERAKEELIPVLLKYPLEYWSAKELSREVKDMNSNEIAWRLNMWMAKPRSVLKGYILEARPQANNEYLQEYRLISVNPQNSRTERRLQKGADSVLLKYINRYEIPTATLVEELKDEIASSNMKLSRISRFMKFEYRAPEGYKYIATKKPGYGIFHRLVKINKPALEETLLERFSNSQKHG